MVNVRALTRAKTITPNQFKIKSLLEKKWRIWKKKNHAADAAISSNWMCSISSYDTVAKTIRIADQVQCTSILVMKLWGGFASIHWSTLEISWGQRLVYRLTEFKLDCKVAGCFSSWQKLFSSLRQCDILPLKWKCVIFTFVHVNPRSLLLFTAR